MISLMSVRKLNLSYGIILLAIMLLALTACAADEQAAEVNQESETVSLEGAESVIAEISMGAGDLQVRGGAAALMEADFAYTIDAWRPEVNYSVDESGDQVVGNLFVTQPTDIDLDANLTNFRYDWDIRFNDDVPLDLRVELGAGSGTLNVGELDLTALDIAAGAGNITVDLTGDRERDLAAAIRGGVGNLTVLLPSDAGVKADVSGGLGQVVATGLSRDADDAFVNEAFDTAEHTIILDIRGGVGELNLEVVE